MTLTRGNKFNVMNVSFACRYHLGIEEFDSEVFRGNRNAEDIIGGPYCIVPQNLGCERPTSLKVKFYL